MSSMPASHKHPESALQQQRRAAMTHAAARLLIEQGPRAITHRGVAEAAGVPIGSANYIAGTRRELYASAVAAAEELRSRSAAEFAESLLDQARDAHEIARVLLRTWYAPNVTDDVVHYRLEPMLDAGADPELQLIMARFRPDLLAALSTVLARSGHPDFSDVDLLAQVIDASLLYASASGAPHPLDAATDATARLIELVSSAQSAPGRR
jgi:DNA-binding transcriptional regulator YbjK